MYDELVKQLREQGNWLGFTELLRDLFIKAADAIEELSAIREEQKAQIIAMAAEDKPRWIPVTERLPEVGQRVMAVGLHGEAMYIGTYTGGIKETEYRKAKPCKIAAHGYGWRTFTYWMQLPKPPKE